MGWYEAIKDAVSVADRLRDAELKEKLAALRMEGAKLAEENAQLRQELLDCKAKAETRKNMEFRDNVYWRVREGGDPEGPFCPKCLDGDDRAARMEDRPEGKFWRCPVCGQSTRKPGPASPPPIRRGKRSRDPGSSWMGN
jgi:hypothetical protein